MKISPRKTAKKPFFIAAGVLALIVIATLTYVFAFNGSILGWNNHNASPKSGSSTNLDKPTDGQVQAGSDIKKENLDKANGDSDTPPAPVTQPGSDKKSVEIIITAANQNNNVLQIRTQIATVTSTGKCTLTLSKAEQTVTKTADIQPLASTSACKGFDIPVSELSLGSWQATLTYENDSLIGSASKVITIK